MSKLKLTYFDFPGGRGEDCRMALFLAGVAFEDDRIKGAQWAELKPSTPYGGLPLLRSDGQPPLGQSNAILAYIGRTYALHPTDAWEAARHEGVMAAVEDMRAALTPSLREKDEDRKRQLREELCTGYLQTWGADMERQVKSPFIGGDQLQVADLKLFTALNWLSGGIIDHIPKDVLAGFTKLDALRATVAAHPKVAEWRARFS